MTSAVVALGAWCELQHEDDRELHFAVQEFALLQDGRRLTLHTDRGCSQRGSRPGSPWLYTDADSITRSALTTVLPDEDTGEEHPWEWLAELVRVHGVAVSSDDLRGVPYRVELGERVTRRLAETAHLRSAR